MFYFLTIAIQHLKKSAIQTSMSYETTPNLSFLTNIPLHGETHYTAPLCPGTIVNLNIL